MTSQAPAPGATPATQGGPVTRSRASRAVPPTTAPTVAFALTPAQATTNLIDYETKSGSTLFHKATEPLPGPKFDCDADGLRDFLQRLSKRADEMGWTTTILTLPDPKQPTVDLNYIRNYGVFDTQTLTQDANSYHPSSVHQTRAAQDSYQLWSCLHASLSKVGRGKVTLRENEYQIQGESVGILLLKLIISKSALESTATTMSVRHRLNALHEYIVTINHDIPTFNLHVATLLETLSSRSQTSTDTLTNLFKAYKKVDDAEFVRYINQKECDYEEEKLPDLTPESLMIMAENRYGVLKDKGVWRTLSAERQEIVALTARLHKAEGTFKKSNDKSDKGKGKNARDDKTKRNRERKPRPDIPWISDPPKTGESNKKTVDGKEWIWCSKHKKWGAHATEDCKGQGLGSTGAANRKQTAPASDKKSKTAGNPRLVQARKATAVRFADLQDDDSTDDE